jgi:hypothetical protein
MFWVFMLDECRKIRPPTSSVKNLMSSGLFAIGTAPLIILRYTSSGCFTWGRGGGGVKNQKLKEPKYKGEK